MLLLNNLRGRAFANELKMATDVKTCQSSFSGFRFGVTVQIKSGEGMAKLTETKVYVELSSTPTEIRQVDELVTGLKTWTHEDGLTWSSITTLSPSGPYWTVKTTAPGGEYVIKRYTSGLLTDVEEYDDVPESSRFTTSLT